MVNHVNAGSIFNLAGTIKRRTYLFGAATATAGLVALSLTAPCSPVMAMPHTSLPIQQPPRGKGGRRQKRGSLLSDAEAISSDQGGASMPYPPRVQAILEYIEGSLSELKLIGSTAMYYEPSRELGNMPLPDVVRGLTPEDVLPPPPPPSEAARPGSDTLPPSSSTKRSPSSKDRIGGMPPSLNPGSSPLTSAVMDPRDRGPLLDATARGHFARVIAALLYVATGGLDHAHNLVSQRGRAEGEALRKIICQQIPVL